MLCKTVAASVIVVWLVLFGVEFSEAAGFIKQVDKDKSVETETARFGVAFRVLDGSQLKSPALTAQFQLFDTFTDPSLCSLGVASYLEKEAQFLKGHFKIFRLHRVLLI